MKVVGFNHFLRDKTKLQHFAEIHKINFDHQLGSSTKFPDKKKMKSSIVAIGMDVRSPQRTLKGWACANICISPQPASA